MQSKPIYQAIALVSGELIARPNTKPLSYTPYFATNYYLVTELGFKIFLFLDAEKHHALAKVPGGTKLFVYGYPKMQRVPGKAPRVFLQALSWNTSNVYGLTKNTAIIRGIYQQIPSSDRPVISVYRNDEAEDYLGLFKPSHLTIHGNLGVVPWSLKEPDRLKYFVQILTAINKHYFDYLLPIAPPSIDIPKYKKPKRNN